MRIIALTAVLLAVPAVLAAQQEPRRGAPVPRRAVQEAEAIRPVVAKETDQARARRLRPPPEQQARPAQRPGGS